MWYTLGYANTFMCAPAHGGRAGNPGDRAPVPVRLYRPPLPDPPGQCRGAADLHDCPGPPLHRPNRPPHHACLSPARSRGAAAPLVTTPHDGDHLRRGALRVPPGAVTPESAHVRPASQPVDPSAGRRGQFRPGPPPRLVSDETSRLALRRLGVAWKRAKHWITSPEPAYARQKNGATS